MWVLLSVALAAEFVEFRPTMPEPRIIVDRIERTEAPSPRVTMGHRVATRPAVQPEVWAPQAPVHRQLPVMKRLPTQISNGMVR